MDLFKKKFSRSCQCVFFCISIGIPATSYSQQWSFEPVVRLTAEYDDNTRLSADESARIDSSAFIIDANGRFIRRAQSSEVRFAPRIRSRSYSESSLENTNDVFLDFYAAKNLERSDFGIQARFSEQDVLTAELDDPDFDNPEVSSPINLDTGRLEIGAERESLILSSFFTRKWTEKIEFGLDADYIDVSYVQSDQTGRTFADYTDASLGAELAYRVSDLSTWTIRVFGGDYEAEAGADRSESQSLGADLEFSHEFSSTMEGRVGVGYQDIDSEVTSGGVTVSDSNGVTVFTAGITKRGDISRVVLDVRQTVDPGGTGFLQERTQLRLKYRRQLSPTLYGNFNARIQTTDEVAPDVILPTGRDQQRYGIGLEWRYSRGLSFRGDYVFTSQEFDDTAGSASSNEVSISLVYEPKRAR